jgi:hypothetical protein
LSQDQLAKRLTNNAITLLPVRYDTLNLVALEAALAGVPIVMSNNAGAVDVLHACGNVPSIQVFDIDHPEHAADMIATMMRAWPQTVTHARTFAAKLQSKTQQLDLRGIYQNALRREQRSTPHAMPSLSGLAQKSSTFAFATLYKTIGEAVRSYPEASVLRRAARGLRSLTQVARTKPLADCNGLEVLELAGKISEKTEQGIADKMAVLEQFRMQTGGGIKVWLELARLERLRNNPLTAACYDLRALRLAGRDVANRKPLVTATLEKSGMGFVNQIYEVIEDAGGVPSPDRVKTTKLEPFTPPPISLAGAQITDDRKPGDRRVSIIVSLYRASRARVERFLSLLSRQTLFQSDLIELIFVDAGGCEFLVDLVRQSDWPLKHAYLYVRTGKRITIQGAWNIGLELSSAPYVCCLGVDETLYPQALETLMRRLEQAPSIDWVMASAVVTELSENGTYIGDKIFYDRSNMVATTTYLETCTVSWVGGLYRRDIHTRFGYYDARYHAAGDTELKMRVLQHLNVEFLPQTLGVLQDYPEQRASGGVRAEIEDSAAWYQYRTPAGVRTMLQALETDQLVAIALQCAGYRKSFSEAMSTDVVMGKSVCGLLRERQAPLDILPALEAFYSARLHEFRAFNDDRSSQLSPRSPIHRTKRFKQLNEDFLAITGQKAYFSGLNDNLFEQHNWVWPAGSEPTIW